MSTKAKAIASAQHALTRKKNPASYVAIYRVGAAWMYTTSSLEATQALYKVPVKEYQQIGHPGNE